MDLKKDIELLNQGILQDSLNFTLTDSGNEIDIQQLQYNAFYKSYEYFENKFPPGHEAIPGFDKVIEYLADNAKSPLDEITERQSVVDEPVVVELPVVEPVEPVLWRMQRPVLPPLINPDDITPTS